MTDREVAEIRRRYRTDKNNIAFIGGCVVSPAHEIASEFTMPVGTMTEDETDSLFSVFRKILSNAGRNLVDIPLPMSEIPDGENGKLLTALRNTRLKDETVLHSLYEKIASVFSMDNSYVILTAYEDYDVFRYSSDGAAEQDSSEVFSYFMCAICPTKEAKPALTFSADEKRFRNVALKSIVANPVIGFMYPAFDDRRANIYRAEYYSRDIKDNHPDVISALFGAEPPMAAAEQKQTFGAVITESIDKACSLDVVQSVHSQLSAMIADHKQSKEKEPLLIGKNTVKRLLRTGGVDEEKIEAFGDKFDEAFGKAAELHPKNIIDPKKFNITTPEATVKIPPEQASLIMTRVIDGVKYILIRADKSVEVNGVMINIEEDEKKEE